MANIRKIILFPYHLLKDICNGLNLCKTIYINFKFLPFGDAVKLPIYIYGRVKFLSMAGSLKISGQVSNKMIVIGRDYTYFEAPQGIALFKLDGLLQFVGKVNIGPKVTVCVEKNAILSIGKYVRISSSVKLKCYKKISIGNYSSVTTESQIFDTNFHFMRNIETGEVAQLSKPVEIGEYCWIGNRTTIMKGTRLPHHTIVSSNSLVSKDFSTINPYCIIGGMPAKLLKENITRVYDWNLYNSLESHFSKSDESYIAYKGVIDESQFIEKSYF